MLVLSRKKNETVDIPELYDKDGNPVSVSITIVEIRGDKARLGFEAPATVPIHRREVWNAIQREDSSTAAVVTESTVEASTGPTAEASTAGVQKAG